MTAEATAIAVAPHGVTGPLLAVIERLVGSGVPVQVVEDLGQAAQVAGAMPNAPPCILLDLRILVAGAVVEDVRVATDRIHKAIEAIPHTMPIAITGAADAGIVLA